MQDELYFDCFIVFCSWYLNRKFKLVILYRNGVYNFDCIVKGKSQFSLIAFQSFVTINTLKSFLPTKIVKVTFLLGHKMCT